MTDGRVISPVTKVVVFALALIAVSGGLVALAPSGTQPLRSGPVWLALAILVAFGVAEQAVFYLEHRREAIAFSLSEVPSVFALVFLDIRVAIAVRVVGSLVPKYAAQRPPVFKMLFNAGIFVFEAAAAAFLLRHLLAWTGDTDTWLLTWVVCSVFATTVVGAVAVLAAIATFEGGFMGHVRGELRSSMTVYGLNAAMAGLTVVPALVAPGLSFLALVPIVVVWMIVRDHGEITQTLRDVEAVHGFAGRIAAELDLDAITRVAVDETMRLLRAKQVDLVVFDGPLALLSCSAGVPLDGLPDHVDDPRWGAVLGGVIESDSGSVAVDDAFAAPVLSEHGVVGVIVVKGREGAHEEFTAAELRRLRTIADQLAGAIGRGLMHRRLEFEARHDLLTGLANRGSCERHLEHLILAATPGLTAFAIMFDLDRFKEVNDTLGHQAGDQLLVEVARRLSEEATSDDVLARFAGDEFSMCGERSSVDEIDALVRACTRAIARPVCIDGLELVVQVSAGVALRTPRDDAATLLRKADIAMYHAKVNHLGHDVYRGEIDRRTPARLSMLADLRTAIDGVELELHFQPKLDLVANLVSGAEVLARWHHPTRGWVPPIEFVKVAEESGLIRSLTDLVLDGSIEAIAALDARGHRLGIAMNLSAHDLLDELLGDRVERRLDQHGVDADRLTLEITEGTLLYDGPRTRATIERLHRIGVRLSIDDFGTGYSSLSYLRQLPVTELKIDRSFITNLVVDAQDETIVRSTIDLGHNLGLQVVAEGVETSEVADRLRTLGCDVAQGFGICRPLPFDQLTTWLVNTSLATRQPNTAGPLPW
jgi:diguanylate cyclase (GGDEF)-like protein